MQFVRPVIYVLSTGPKPPTDSDILIKITLKMDSVLFWLVCCLASLGVAYSSSCVAFNIYYSELRWVTANTH